MLPLRVKLFQTEKETKENKQVEIGSVLVSVISTSPTEDSKYDSSDTEDEENTQEQNAKVQKGVASRVKSVRVLKKFIEKVLSQKANDIDNDNMEIDINDIQGLYENVFKYSLVLQVRISKDLAFNNRKTTPLYRTFAKNQGTKGRLDGTKLFVRYHK